MMSLKEEEWPAWTEEWPIAPGWYWFYGQLFSHNGVPVGRMELVPVSVNRGGGSSVFYVTQGTFIYKRSAKGVWAPAIVPTLPPEPSGGQE